MTHFVVRVGRGFERVVMADIRYVESSRKYCRIWLAQRFVFAPVSLKDMEAQLPASEFVRIHRAYLISLRHLNAFDYTRVWVDGKALPVGKRRFAELKEAVSILLARPAGAEKEVERV